LHESCRKVFLVSSIVWDQWGCYSTSSPKWLCAVFSPTTPPKPNRPGFLRRFSPTVASPRHDLALRLATAAVGAAPRSLCLAAAPRCRGELAPPLFSLHHSPPRFFCRVGVASLAMAGARLSRLDRPRHSSSDRSAPSRVGA
jgi:hypothetical protein